VTGDVIFEGVTFGYDGIPVVEDISFHVKPGQTVALVGATGSGKSTLTKLLNRTYDPDAGRILVDGVDLRAWELGTLRTRIAVIEQDVTLFSRSIAENIAFGTGRSVDRQHIEQVARAAEAHAFISSFADGYDTVVGERGAALSGGQRQRLAIARALLADPRILVMDDATSAIDSATEAAIQQAIHRVAAGRTTVLITHRLAQIKRADTIVVLQGGRLIDQGTHEDLLRRCPLYRRIFAAYL
jgi:ATP-binding cassette subfamily B protein